MNATRRLVAAIFENVGHEFEVLIFGVSHTHIVAIVGVIVGGVVILTYLECSGMLSGLVSSSKEDKPVVYDLALIQWLQWRLSAAGVLSVKRMHFSHPSISRSYKGVLGGGVGLYFRNASRARLVIVVRAPRKAVALELQELAHAEPVTVRVTRSIGHAQCGVRIEGAPVVDALEEVAQLKTLTAASLNGALWQLAYVLPK